MKKLKNFFVATLSALLLLTFAIPAFAADPSFSSSPGLLQPHYTNIFQSDCSLSADSNGTATVKGWATFVSGKSCTVSVVLKRNGKIVESWSKKSSTGSVRISETVSGLSTGNYQAVATVTCGSDKATISSTVETIS